MPLGDTLIENLHPLKEAVISARNREKMTAGPPGIDLQTFVSEGCGATSFSTGIATFMPGAYLPYHAHGFSEAVTVLEGHARVLVEGRAYHLNPRDCVHVPAGTAHQVEN